MDDALEGADVIMMLRLQRERMQSGFVPSVRDYFYGYGLTRARLNRAKPTAIVLHPGPLNRGVEIASDVADDQSQSRILNQVELGVAMRQAILALLLA
jgi:aspartate carbamoyltransferase catalytic subunit